MTKLLKIDIVNATKKHNATLFLFHGSGIYIYIHIILLNSINIIIFILSIFI